MLFLRTLRRSSAATRWSDPVCCIGSSAMCSGAMISLTSAVLQDKSEPRVQGSGGSSRPTCGEPASCPARCRDSAGQARTHAQGDPITYPPCILDPVRTALYKVKLSDDKTVKTYKDREPILTQNFVRCHHSINPGRQYWNWSVTLQKNAQDTRVFLTFHYRMTAMMQPVHRALILRFYDAGPVPGIVKEYSINAGDLSPAIHPCTSEDTTLGRAGYLQMDNTTFDLVESVSFEASYDYLYSCPRPPDPGP
jgi:hypothetical protein